MHTVFFSLMCSVVAGVIAGVMVLGVHRNHDDKEAQEKEWLKEFADAAPAVYTVRVTVDNKTDVYPLSSSDRQKLEIAGWKRLAIEAPPGIRRCISTLEWCGYVYKGSHRLPTEYNGLAQLGEMDTLKRFEPICNAIYAPAICSSDDNKVLRKRMVPIFTYGSGAGDDTFGGNGVISVWTPPDMQLPKWMWIGIVEHGRKVAGFYIQVG